MGEKGNAVDVADATSGATDGRVAGVPGGSGAAEAVSAAAEARGKESESTSEMVGGLVAKTGGEFLAGAVLGAATEKLEDRSKRKTAAKKAAGGGNRAEH